jgi:predicted outer membrane repeat protein
MLIMDQKGNSAEKNGGGLCAHSVVNVAMRSREWRRFVCTFCCQGSYEE